MQQKNAEKAVRKKTKKAAKKNAEKAVRKNTKKETKNAEEAVKKAKIASKRPKTPKGQ